LDSGIFNAFFVAPCQDKEAVKETKQVKKKWCVVKKWETIHVHTFNNNVP
jgi:hypothetical protein